MFDDIAIVHTEVSLKQYSLVKINEKYRTHQKCPREKFFNGDKKVRKVVFR